MESRTYYPMGWRHILIGWATLFLGLWIVPYGKYPVVDVIVITMQLIMLGELLCLTQAQLREQWYAYKLHIVMEYDESAG